MLLESIVGWHSHSRANQPTWAAPAAPRDAPATLPLSNPARPSLPQSLQERDPRAYQLYFAPGAPGPSPASPPGPRAAGPAFLACTPERLYARTGRHVASEAVAGTRPRGRGGDIEQVRTGSWQLAPLLWLH